MAREIKATEQRLIKREDMLDRKLDTLGMKEKNLENVERSLADRTRNVQSKEQQLDQTLSQQKDTLLRITNMNMDDAKALLMSRIENDVRHEAAVMIDKVTEQAKDEAKVKATNIFCRPCKRYAVEVTSEGTTKSVQILPVDDKDEGADHRSRRGRNIWRLSRPPAWM